MPLQLPTKGKTSPLHLIIAGIVAIIGFTIFTCVFISNIFSPAAKPTATAALSIDAIFTQSHLTAWAPATQTAIILTLTPQPTPTLTPTITFTPAPTASPAPLPSPTFMQILPTPASLPSAASCIPPGQPQVGTVTRVVDGDTIHALIDGVDYSVRYIGMDTPENTTQVEPGGVEAYQKNRQLVEGRTVMLYRDTTETDRYGRLLRYVLADGIFINYELVATGFAEAKAYPPDTACHQTFLAAQQIAGSSRSGSVAPIPLDTPASAAAVCSCSSNQYNCGDFSTHNQAQACYDYCISQGRGDVHKLDGDSNGLACESLP